MKLYLLLLLISTTNLIADFKPKARPNALPSYGQNQIVPQAQETPQEQADEFFDTMENPDPNKHDLDDVGFGQDPDMSDWD